MAYLFLTDSSKKVFFHKGIRHESERNVRQEFDGDRRKIETLGRQVGTVQRLHQLLQRKPILSVPLVAQAMKVTTPTARAAVEALEKMKILREITGRRRDRLYAYTQYMKILDEGTEPLPRIS